ncbi:aminotransferase class I/II-fold pyridoxal phosphate-dependent enzyme [Cylindrospermopsis raciborskii CHAB3438]|uniref:aminotransferase class I/II-fold pyridoxal phosphate-dependent enzyme n=1 Tax=Cylindrospermopsis raciborskii TaxID=77022 RepID=UPI001F0F3DB3|nr:aminotransferase class I/II-fold pyridoxal phosphate-dependent enzyme [Cylindrospermopsis raciborskii]MCH4904565.1 aminotransferase class I/II-fold pyridoxal phosphate-dependent enzyme [Cylindrospermopsis raciborskii CHAB3438]MEB3146369.1 aminotransferase class I/II-fold pyridoxal phosphate-dependent enzyme [Cylindrospermopsis raciborskii]
MLNQSQTPLIDALKSSISKNHTPFYTPGHKRGAGVSPILTDLLGKDVFRADLTELSELDNLFAPESAILAAQELAAMSFGAKRTWFLVNGSSCGIIAAIMTVCGPNQHILLPRNIHLSVVSGLIIAGAIPIFINPQYDQDVDITCSITPKDLEIALAQHPQAKAVLVVYPTYNGVCGNLKAICQVTHEHNIPLIVDEAHGAHLNFHDHLPISALTAGADLTIQSIHKTLGSMTQTSMLHVQGNRINIDRLNQALQLVQSTSPSFILLASLDAARQQMAIDGQKLMQQTLELANIARNKIREIPGLSVLELPKIRQPGFFDLDKTRLTVNVKELSITGFAAENFLIEMGIVPEVSSFENVTFIISLGNNESDINALVKVFKKINDIPRSRKYEMITSNIISKIIFNYQPDNRLGISPREAFFATSEILPLEKTVDRICAENICPYPPGIPILMPGERITKSALDYLQQVQDLGGVITGCLDASCHTLKVVK